MCSALHDIDISKFLCLSIYIMEKKKFEVPTIEVFELELENAILQTSGEDMIPMDVDYSLIQMAVELSQE